MGIATLYIGICFHLSAQFEFLVQHLKSIDVDYAEPDTTGTANKKCATSIDRNNRLKIELDEFVRLHLKAFDLCDEISATFAPIIFVHFLSCAFLTCAGCLMLFLAHGAEKITYLVFVVLGFADVFLHTYSGHLIIDASESVSEAAYNLSWYECDMKIRKQILMIITRAQKASAINIPFIRVSLDTYLKVSANVLLYRYLLIKNIFSSCRSSKQLFLISRCSTRFYKR